MEEVQSTFLHIFGNATLSRKTTATGGKKLVLLLGRIRQVVCTH
jgi:hypothetical protein